MIPEDRSFRSKKKNVIKVKLLLNENERNEKKEVKKRSEHFSGIVIVGGPFKVFFFWPMMKCTI